MLTDQVVAEIVKAKEIGDMIMAVNLMRLIVLLQSSFDQQQPVDLVSPLTQLLVFCHKEIMANASEDSEKDLEDWLGVVCGAISTIALIPTGVDHTQMIVEFF